MSKNARKGAEYEQQWCDYAARRLGDDRIERRVRNGKNDRGDVTGLRIHGKRAVVELKNCREFRLSDWIGQAEAERGNDDAEFGIVSFKRSGCGEKSFGGNYALMTVDTLLAIIAGGFENLEE